MVQQYLARFRMWAPQSGYSDTDLSTRFRRGLSDDLKDLLAYQDDDKSDTYAKLVALATRLDHARQLRIAEKAYDKGKGTGLPSLYGGAYTSTSTHASAFVDPNAMEIDSMGRWKLKETVKQQRIRDGVCIRCGKKGHFARDCQGNSQAATVAVVEEAPATEEAGKEDA